MPKGGATFLSPILLIVGKSGLGQGERQECRPSPSAAESIRSIYAWKVRAQAERPVLGDCSALLVSSRTSWLVPYENPAGDLHAEEDHGRPGFVQVSWRVLSYLISTTLCTFVIPLPVSLAK